MAVLPAPHRFTVEDYYRMSEVGLLQPDIRTELLEGEIVEMATIGSHHAECVNRLNMFFAGRLADQVVVSVQNPVRLDEHSEPQPDVTLVRRREGGYAQAHPQPSDVLLLIEVADTTARFDRLRKMPLYGRFDIAEVWLIDLPGRVIERRLNPQDSGWGRLDVLGPGDEIAPAFAPEVSIAVDDLLA